MSYRIKHSVSVNFFYSPKDEVRIQTLNSSDSVVLKFSTPHTNGRLDMFIEVADLDDLIGVLERAKTEAAAKAEADAVLDEAIANA